MKKKIETNVICYEITQLLKLYHKDLKELYSKMNDKENNVKLLLRYNGKEYLYRKVQELIDDISSGATFEDIVDEMNALFKELE